MEAYMYRLHPQTLKVLELLRQGAIGQVRLIEGVYGFNVPFNAEGRLYNKALGGGGILDVGCYPVSSSRLFAGAALGKRFVDPIDVQAQGFVGETGVDEWTSAVVKFPGDIVAQWTTGLRVSYENHVRIYGTGGYIHISRPHHPSYWGGDTQIIVNRGFMAPVQEITIPCPKPLFTNAIEAFAKAVLDGKKQIDSPGMTWDDTLGNMRALDLWRERIGLKFDADR
jgi:predicted dehydrogenase